MKDEFIQITHEQAKHAFVIIYNIINHVFPEGSKPYATQVNLHPEMVEDMRKLVEEARNNEQKQEQQ